MACVYKITNNINQKSYIGKTLHPLEKRWKEHCNDSKRERNKNRPLYRAMNKYGIENFLIEELEKTDDYDYLSEREIFWIEYYNTYGKNGYNATKGGDGKQYLDYQLIIDTYSKEQNASSVARILNITIDTVIKALKLNNIDLKKSADVIADTKRKEVKMLSKDGEFIKLFSSGMEAAIFICKNENIIYNIKKTKGMSCHISQVCNNKRQSAYGFKWEFNIK